MRTDRAQACTRPDPDFDDPALDAGGWACGEFVRYMAGEGRCGYGIFDAADRLVGYHYSAGSEDASMPPLPVRTSRLLVATLVIPNHLPDLKGFGRAPTA